MSNYKYKTLSLSVSGNEDYRNRKLEEFTGWELVEVTNLDRDGFVLAIFRKEI